MDPRNPDDPWPDHPAIADLPPVELDEDLAEEDDWHEPPSEQEIEEEEGLILRRQRLFRWAAQSIAIAFSELPEVRKVAAFGAAANPLEREVPRFRKFRRHQIEVLHECADLDLAVWTADLTRLKELKRALAKGLAPVQDTPYGGVAHHQVDVHVFDAAGDYRGRLCIFGQCPKPGKRECLVPGCGAQPFLQQFARYRFKPGQFAGEPKVILFDRAAGFLSRIPRMDAEPRKVIWTKRDADADLWGRWRGRRGRPLLGATLSGTPQPGTFRLTPAAPDPRRSPV